MFDNKIHVVEILYSSFKGWDGSTFKITAPYLTVNPRGDLKAVY
jgi:hypothetical protein